MEIKEDKELVNLNSIKLPDTSVKEKKKRGKKKIFF